ncbi:hypothetical protein M513_13028 [Trichuris suis]|uniref:Uncharacterized protein n=1 Tax=Trichuris suis TaxID=68888 RepID=A0A085LM98_9BILA|nr:hypothetical protein M513_13028 [Trichuris suis]
MEQALAESAVAEHTAHCRASLQTRVVWKQSRLCGRRMKEAFFMQSNQYINPDRGAEISDIRNNLVHVTTCCDLA